MRQLSPDHDPGFAHDLARCRDQLRVGSRTFLAASLFLPKRVRDAAAALYAFCREADDAIDHAPGGADALDALNERLDRIFAGRPFPTSTDRALAAVVADHGLPRAPLDALITGFTWDAEGRHYGDVSALTAYAVRVAGTVGLAMAWLMGAREPATLARALDLGIAMQFTNIARDVGEDARAGRVYLPADWLREAGVAPEDLGPAPRFSPGLGHVIGRLLALADTFYARADAGIEALPAPCRPAIRAARLLYAEIGRAVERQGLDSVSRRAFVPPTRKAVLAAQAWIPREAPAAALRQPPQAEGDELVRAVVQGAIRHAQSLGAVPAPIRGVEGRAVWLLNLFERLEREDLARVQAIRGRAG